MNCPIIIVGLTEPKICPPYPHFVHSIEAAVRNCNQEVFFITDSPDLSRIAKDAGASVVHVDDVETLRNFRTPTKNRPNHPLDHHSCRKWFLTEDFMEQRKIPRACTIDWDVVLLRPLEPTLQIIAGAEAAACVGEQSPTFVQGAEMLKEFRRRTLEKHNTAERLECDMVTWSAIYLASGPRVKMLTEPLPDGSIWDQNIGDKTFQSRYEWDPALDCKRIYWEKGVPRICYRGQRLVLNQVHCWGAYKKRGGLILRRAETQYSGLDSADAQH